MTRASTPRLAHTAVPRADSIIVLAPGNQSARDRMWIFTLAAALEARELAECAGARDRLILERLRRINPVMVRNVEASQP